MEEAEARNQLRLRLNHQLLELFLGLPSHSCAVDVGATAATGSSAKRNTLHEHMDASASATSTLLRLYLLRLYIC